MILPRRCSKSLSPLPLCDSPAEAINQIDENHHWLHTSQHLQRRFFSQIQRESSERTRPPRSDTRETIPKRAVALRNWWAHQDSNLGPMDSHSHGFSTVCGLSHLPRQRAALGSGTLLPVIKSSRCFICEATCSQVVSAPSDSVLSAWLRIAGRAEARLRFP